MYIRMRVYALRMAMVVGCWLWLWLSWGGGREGGSGVSCCIIPVPVG